MRSEEMRYASVVGVQLCPSAQMEALDHVNYLFRSWTRGRIVNGVQGLLDRSATPHRGRADASGRQLSPAASHSRRIERSRVVEQGIRGERRAVLEHAYGNLYERNRPSAITAWVRIIERHTGND